MVSSKEVMPGVSIAPRLAATDKGAVEFDLWGTEGPVVLSLPAGLGGVDQGRVMAHWLDDGAYRILSLSRPGYLGTPLDSGRTIEQQADLMAALLDHLQIERVAVLSLSGSGPVAYMFAARHPERVWALVAIDSVSGSHDMPDTAGPLAQALFMSPLGQKLFKLFTAHKPRLLLDQTFRGDAYFTIAQRKTHVDYALQSPQALTFLTAFIDTMSPFAAHKQGYVNDTAQLRHLTPLPVEEITCPSLIIHGTHDADVKFHDGVYAYEHIAGSERHWIEEGDHLGFWLSPSAHEVQDVARAFLAKHAPERTEREDREALLPV